jgi:hypothetical protein
MEIKLETLEAKRDEYKKAVEGHKAQAEWHMSQADANQGALLAIEELLAVAKAPQPENKTKEK